MCSCMSEPFASYSEIWMSIVEPDSPALSASFLFLSAIMDSGAVKAARQGHWCHFSAPPGAVCQSWLWLKASPAINNRVNQLATGGCPGVKVSVNCEHSSPSYTCFTVRTLEPGVASLAQAAAFKFEHPHFRVMRVHINLQAQRINSEPYLSRKTRIKKRLNCKGHC